MIAHATGLGKGLFPIWIAQQYPRHVKEHGLLFIAHRRKILFQAYERFKAAFGDDLWIGLEMGENEVTGREDCVFMSIDSVGRVYQNRIRKYRDREFGIVFTDESHHLQRESKWDRVLGFFGVGSERERTIEVKGYECNPLAIHLTATPEDQMAPFVDTVAHSMSVLDGIKRGWLTDIKSYHVRNVNTVEGLVAAYGRYLMDDQTLVFASSVDESKRLTQALNEVVNTCHIDAETPKDKRRDIFSAFQNGTIKALSNRLVLTEGVDLPETTAMLDNAPPSNQRVATQKWGRIVRPHPEANVDEFDTPTERRKAIRRSPKPFATLLCTYDPTETGISLTQALTGRDIDIQEDGSLVVEEIIEVLEEYEDERPDVDVEQMEEFDPSTIRAEKADIFRRTVYNDRLQGITKLEWIWRDDDTMALWLPQNPFTNDWKYENVPTVVQLRNSSDNNSNNSDNSGDNVVQRRIISGGYNGEFPVSVKTGGWADTRFSDMQNAMENVDRWLWKNHRPIYRKVLRGSSHEASQNLKEHLRRKGIPVADDVSEETARLLRADSKINNKINQVE